MKNQTLVTVIIATLIVSLALVIGLMNLPIEKHSDYITVGGQAEVPVAPDQAAVYLSVDTHAATAEEAQSQNADGTNAVKAALHKAGIADAGIETSDYYLNKHTDWTNDGPVDNGYDLQHTLKVYANVTAVSAVVDAAVQAGANRIDSIQFQVSEAAKEKAVAEAMTEATEAAKAKAERVTQGIGVRLDRVLKIEESGYWVTVSSEAPAMDSYVPQGYEDAVITPQRMAVQENVNVVFAVN